MHFSTLMIFLLLLVSVTLQPVHGDTRKTHMCKCTSPRRTNPGSAIVDSTKDIPLLSTSAQLSPCFDFRLAHCPNSHSKEHLGAIFIQKECSGAGNLQTFDLSVIAINENGYPYGKLEVNKRMQLCQLEFSPAPPPPGILNYKLALHELQPVPYQCDNKGLNLTLVEYGNKKPSWLSINAALDPVAVGMPPHALQVVLVDQVQTSGGLHPSHLQFVAEFSVQNGASVETYRLLTDHRELAFANGKVSLATSPTKPNPITIDLEYLEDDLLKCSTPKGFRAPVPPIPNPNHMICRYMDGEEKIPPTAPGEYPATSPPITCYDFQFISTPTPDIFYVRLEQPGGAACANFQITQLVFTVLGRDQTGATMALGDWKAIPEDKLSTSCGAGTPPVIWKPNLGLSFQYCPPDQTTKMLFFYYKTIESGEAVCAEWKMPKITGSGKPPPFKEIQAGFKMYFLKGTAQYKYVARSKEIYEVTSGTPTVVKLADQTNPRVDLIMYKPPIAPSLRPPVPRNTDMCICKLRRDPDRDAMNPINFDFLVSMPLISDTPELSPCFEFKWVECPLSGSEELLGAQFIQKPCSRYPNLRTLDVNVVAMNEKGYPYGEFLVNKLVRACFNSPMEVLTHRPFIHKLDVVDFECEKFSGNTLYGMKPPKWSSVIGDFKVGSGDPPAVLQFFFKEKILTVSDPRPKSLQMIAEFAVETSKTPRETAVYRILTSHLQLAFGADGKVSLGGSTTLPQDIMVNWDYLDQELKNGHTKLQCENPPTFTDIMPPNPAWVICRFMIGEETGKPPPFNNRIKDCFRTSFKNDPPNSKDFYMSIEKISGTAPCDTELIQQTVFSVLLREKEGASKIAGEWSVVPVSDYNSKCSATPSGSLTPVAPSSKNLQYCRGLGDKVLFFNFRVLEAVGDILCAKWTMPHLPSSNMVQEVQGAFKMYFGNDKSTFHYFGRHPDIYEVLPVPSTPDSFNIQLVSKMENDRVDILLRHMPDFGKGNALQPSRVRKSHMCRCLNPRRAGGVPVNATLDIPPYMSSSSPPCFEFRFANCPHANTQENLGAIFLQNPCAGNPKLVDVSFVAINDLGFPYGKLMANEFIRTCDFAPSPPATPPLEILKFQPLLHKVRPVSYVCDDKSIKPEFVKYGNNKPEWLSVAADTQVQMGERPVAIQVILKDALGSTSPHPSSLKIVAEFAVEEAAGIFKTYRMETESVQTTPGSDGKIPWPVSPAATPIETSLDYLDEDSPGCPAPNPESGLAPTPPGQENWLLCNCFEWEQRSMPLPPGPQLPQSKVPDCIDVVLNYPTSTATPPFTFYMSLAKTGGPGCGSIQILQTVLVIFVRSPTTVNKYQTDLRETWSKVNDDTDYTAEICLGTSSPSPITSQATGKYHVPDCPPRKLLMFYHYRNLKEEGDIICAKWTLAEVKPGVTEIQGGFKLLYADGNNIFTYSAKHPEIYEIRSLAGKFQVTKVSEKKNPRVDLLLPTNPYPTSFGNCILTPFIPSSDICDCLQRRHGGFTQDPPNSLRAKVLDLAELTLPTGCITFEMVKCTEDGVLYDTIGALLVFDPEKCGTTLKYIVQDISFQALNQEGYPFGESLHSTFLRNCLTPETILDYKVRNLMFANPKAGICDGRVGPPGTIAPQFQYPGVPGWVAVNAMVNLEALGTKKTAIQIYLKKPCPSSMACAKFTPLMTQVQFIAEMYINDRTGLRFSAIYKIKTKVYPVGYGATKNFVVADPFEPTTEPDIVPNPDFYDTHSPRCRNNVGSVGYTAIDSQHCGCWRFTNDDPTAPAGTARPSRLLPTNPIHKNFDTCINFLDKETVPTSMKLEPRPTDLRFFLTVWTPIQPMGDECKNIDITLTVITPLKQTNPKPNQQKGIVHGEFQRATRFLGEDCPVPMSYPPPNSVIGASSVLRRPPPSFSDTCTKPGTGSSEMFFLPYPLEEQDDKRNGFCAPWTVPEESGCCGTPSRAPTRRFEFQFVGEFAVLDKSVMPPKEYFALKRSMIYEHAPLPLPKTPSSTPYPYWGRKMFPVQEASSDHKNCDTDICLIQ